VQASKRASKWHGNAERARMIDALTVRLLFLSLAVHRSLLLVGGCCFIPSSRAPHSLVAVLIVSSPRGVVR